MAGKQRMGCRCARYASSLSRELLPMLVLKEFRGGVSRRSRVWREWDCKDP